MHTMTERSQHRERVSRLRQEAVSLLRDCRRLLQELLQPGPMIAGSFYQMYKKCGRPGCRCTRGDLHGPCPVISIARKGRRSTRSVPRDRQDEVRRRAESYRSFQRKRRRLREMFRRLERIVEDIREAHLVDFP